MVQLKFKIFFNESFKMNFMSISVLLVKMEEFQPLFNIPAVILSGLSVIQAFNLPDGLLRKILVPAYPAKTHWDWVAPVLPRQIESSVVFWLSEHQLCHCLPIGKLVFYQQI